MRTQDAITEMWGILHNPNRSLTRTQTLQQVSEVYARGTDRILVAIRALPHNSPMVRHLKQDLDTLKQERAKIIEKIQEQF